MYNGNLLNGELNRILGNMRHTDKICIGDCGLPVPRGVEVVDLALKLGMPGFMEVLQLIAECLGIEEAVIAAEMKTENEPLYNELQEMFRNIPVTEVKHEEFKERTGSCVAVIRTGENHPYANIILQAKCIF